MKRRISIGLLMLLFSLFVKAEDKDVRAMQAMAERLIPAYAKDFLFEKIEPVNDKDSFSLDVSPEGKIVVRGNKAKTSGRVSWMGGMSGGMEEDKTRFVV